MTAGRAEIDADAAWRLLRALADRARLAAPLADGVEVALEDAGALAERPAGTGWIALDAGAARGWRPVAGAIVDLAAGRLLDLYVPLCAGPGRARFVLGHLAQSLDGRIATENGASRFISGPEDLEHAHRLRALFDAVLVGAGTVELDDPRLTTRLVDGPNPTRVVIDPERRLSADRAVFADGEAATLLVCRAAAAGPVGARHGRAEIVAVAGPPAPAPLPIGAVLEALARRGLGRVFIEGGGITLSHVLAAGALDRLHVAVAPCILGSGRPGVRLPPIGALADAIALDATSFALGRDVLFDCVMPPVTG